MQNGPDEHDDDLAPSVDEHDDPEAEAFPMTEEEIADVKEEEEELDDDAIVGK